MSVVREKKEKRSSSTRKVERKKKKRKQFKMEDIEDLSGSITEFCSDEEDEDDESKLILLKTFSTLCNNEYLSDVHFIVGVKEKRRIPAHRVILSARSEVFERMLFGPMREGSTDMDIEVPDIDPSSFLAVLRFVYTAKVKLTPETG